MSFTVLPLTQPQGYGSNGLTDRKSGAVDLDLAHLLGSYKPEVRDADVKVVRKSIDYRQVAVLWTRGVLPHEIAEVMGLSDVILDELMRSEEFVAEVNGLQATREITSLEKALEATSAEALICIRDLMKRSPNDAVKAKCAMYVIDQHRGKAPQHIQLTGGRIVEDPKAEIERMKKKLGYT
jgi:hypothetical protein